MKRRETIEAVFPGRLKNRPAEEERNRNAAFEGDIDCLCAAGQAGYVFLECHHADEVPTMAVSWSGGAR